MNNVKLLLGVCGSIAAHRALDLSSEVVKNGGEVRVVMTRNAMNLIQPAAFEAITENKVTTSLWEADHPGEMDHLALTKWANAFAIAPASANTISRLAHGLAEDAIGTFAMAWPDQMVIAPAMNPTMYQNAFLQQNILRLRALGHHVVEPVEGRTACGDVGVGRLAPVEEILEEIMRYVQRSTRRPDLRGETFLITSGPTREFADPVRCITNPSTGKMGLALARQAHRCGANVILVSGPTELPLDHLRFGSIEKVVTADEMKAAVLKHLPKASCAVFAAAVSDWKPEKKDPTKMKKEGGSEEISLKLVRTPDVALAASKERREDQFFIGFAAESDDLEQNAREKLHRKSFNMIVANPINQTGVGFGADRNQATLVDGDWRMPLPEMTKDQLALEILAEYAKRKAAGTKSSVDLPEEEAAGS